MDSAEKRLVKLLKVLANKDRVRLLLSLDDRTLSVGEPVEELGRSRPRNHHQALSRKTLRSSGGTRFRISPGLYSGWQDPDLTKVKMLGD